MNDPVTPMSFESFKGIFSFLLKIESLPTIVLVYGACIALGYFWRFLPANVTIWKFSFGFPNVATPVWVALCGVLMMVLGTPIPEGMITRIFIVRSVAQGAIIGLAAWISHALLLKRIEDRVLKAFPSMQDTAFFQNKSPNQPETPADSSKPNP